MHTRGTCLEAGAVYLATKPEAALVLLDQAREQRQHLHQNAVPLHGHPSFPPSAGRWVTQAGLNSAARRSLPCWTSPGNPTCVFKGCSEHVGQAGVQAGANPGNFRGRRWSFLSPALVSIRQRRAGASAAAGEHLLPPKTHRLASRLLGDRQQHPMGQGGMY
jgi:hypothetical protein